MSVDEMIERLKALPDDVRKLPLVGYESSFLIELERPRIATATSIALTRRTIARTSAL